MSNIQHDEVCFGNRHSSWPLCLSIWLVLTMPSLAVAADPMAGEWQGPYTIAGSTESLLHLKLLQATDGSWAGKLKVHPDSTAFEDVLRLSIHGTAVSFRYDPPQIPGQVIFSGNYQSWNDAIKGIVIVGNDNIPVLLERVGLHPDAAAAAAADSAQLAMQEEFEIAQIRHEKKFAVVGGTAYWVPVHVVKDDTKNINDVTSADWAFNAGVRWHVIDQMAMNFRYVRGGLGFDSSDENLQPFAPLGLNKDSYLQIDGFEADITAYLGNSLFRKSKFNPFVTFLVGYYDWQLSSSGRDSEPIQILEEPVTGKDWGAGLGLGTEYPLGKHLALQFSWLWQFVFTEDETKWDKDLFWSNTTFWSLNFALVINLF